MQETCFNFVIDCTAADLNKYLSLDLSKNPEMLVGAKLEWNLQTYIILKQREKLDVKCSNYFVPGCINIIHSDDLIRLKGSSKDFIVCVKGDFPLRRWAHYHIVQNQNDLRPKSSVLPLWIQPGLITRNLRRNGVTRIAYAGQTWNGNLAGSEKTWVELFKPHGIEFLFLPPGSCHDLSEIDVLIGIRSFDTKPYNSKPPSKLINAWHSHIPFIGGHDSAYKQVGIPGEHYLLATTFRDVLDAVLHLRDDANLYQTIVRNGIEKTAPYNNEMIAKQWEETLTGPVVQRYNNWLLHYAYEQTRFHALSHVAVVKHHSKQLVKRMIKA